MDTVHRGARADHRVQAEHGLVRVLRGQTVHQVDFGAHGDGGTGGRVGDLLDDVCGGASAVGGVDHLHRAFGVHNHLDARVCLACTFDLFDGEALVHGAEALPQNHLGSGVIGRVGGTALSLERIPQRHLAQRNTHGAGGVAAKVLVREEQHALAARERPFQYGVRVGGRAHDAAVASAECLQRRGGVHVGDRDNLLTTIGIRLGAADLAELIPAFLHLVDVCHVGHGAAGGQVGQGHTLFGGGEDIGGFSHEVHAAEHDMVGVRAFGGVLGQLEGVAHKVGMLDDFVTLVEVAEDQQFGAETLLGVGDALLQFLVGGLAVFVRQHLLARRVGGQMVEHRGTGTVAGCGGVEVPRVLGQSCVAGALRAQLGDDLVNGRRSE